MAARNWWDQPSAAEAGGPLLFLTEGGFIELPSDSEPGVDWLFCLSCQTWWQCNHDGPTHRRKLGSWQGHTPHNRIAYAVTALRTRADKSRIDPIEWLTKLEEALQDDDDLLGRFNAIRDGRHGQQLALLPALPPPPPPGQPPARAAPGLPNPTLEARVAELEELVEALLARVTQLEVQMTRWQ